MGGSCLRDLWRISSVGFMYLDVFHVSRRFSWMYMFCEDIHLPPNYGALQGKFGVGESVHTPAI